MRILILSGSRNPEGQTARAAAALAAGAAAAGCEIETLYLPTLRIERCRQCDNDGWGLCRHGERCVIEDDIIPVTDKVREAHVVVVATPVYFSDLAESLRAYLDRLRRVCVHGGKKDRIEGKPAVGVCVAGGGGGGAPRCTVNLEWTLQTIGFDVVDMIPVRRQNLEMKLDVLRRTGAWLGTRPRSV